MNLIFMVGENKKSRRGAGLRGRLLSFLKGGNQASSRGLMTPRVFLLAPCGAQAVLFAQEAPKHSLSELGRHLNRDVAALSQAALQLTMQIGANLDLTARRDAFQKRLEKV
jgi:hypothetical protein